MTIRLTDRAFEIVNKIAELEGTSIADCVGEGLRAYLQGTLSLLLADFFNIDPDLKDFTVLAKD